METQAMTNLDQNAARYGIKNLRTESFKKPLKFQTKPMRDVWRRELDV
jgi:hypothetical protein